MIPPFFHAAMVAPARQLTFRRLVVGHTLILTLVFAVVAESDSPTVAGVAGQLLLVLGIVEGAALIGWRLTQMPKSLAMEFLLVSPVRPTRLFLVECGVGVARFALVSLAPLPVFGLLVLSGLADSPDLIPLAVMPFVWGTVAGTVLTTWVYEPARVRRIGELLGLLGVLVYLVVGVMAGEHLRTWLLALPEWAGAAIFHTLIGLHERNPFEVVRYWFNPGRSDPLAWDRVRNVNLLGLAVAAAATLRSALRLQGHFHDRHYKPIDSSRATQTELIGDRPLSWWAVRRVMEYSGRVNLYLANGFALTYAAYILAGDAWPPWLGQVVFRLFESWGGAPMVATALAVLASVPAAYQFGLWDQTAADRCKRLELLLLTDLGGMDYAHAAFSAAWRRGRGYFVGAVALWVASAAGGRIGWADAVAAAVGGASFWAFAFAVGFRGFASGHQTNGQASLLTLGLPLLLWMLLRAGLEPLAAIVPTGVVYLPAGGRTSWAWAGGFVLLTATAAFTVRRGLRRCEGELRAWYDANQGQRSAA